jgi:hypothetical protein
MKFQRNRVALAVGVSLALGLVACGGGDDALPSTGVAAPTDIASMPGTGTTTVADTGSATVVVTPPPPPPPPPPVTLTGSVVVDQAIRNAVVCMDLNANNACDAGEPVSAKTGVDGAYSLTYEPSRITPAQVAAASLIAPMVPGAATDSNTSIDASDTTKGVTTRAYTLKQIPGKAGSIHPLSTLLAAGVATGMTESVARSNAALQLAVTLTKLDNYQDDPTTDSAQVRDNARTMARVVAATLEGGIPLQLADQNQAVTAAAGDLASLTFTDAANYFFRQFTGVAKPAGTPGGSSVDGREGKTAGVASTALYNQAALAPTGWLKCDSTVLGTGTIGVPSRSTTCSVSNSIGASGAATSIADQTMTAVITGMQADPTTNTINNGVSNNNLVTALGTATFPPNASLRLRTSLNLNQPILINSLTTDGRPQSEATTLEALIAAKPASAVNLATGGGSLSLGLSSSQFKALRVAFTGTTSASAGTVQFYDCDLNAAQTVVSNCMAVQTGNYAISTVNGVRVMRFSGHSETIMGNIRLYTEVKNTPSVIGGGDWVFMARENKPSEALGTTRSVRLNATGWAAMKAKLGL